MLRLFKQEVKRNRGLVQRMVRSEQVFLEGYAGEKAAQSTVEGPKDRGRFQFGTEAK